MDQPYLRSVDLKSIHGRYDLRLDFNETLNVLHGHNGTGKSTLIHIIANVANCDFARFAFLDFKKISIDYSNNRNVTIKQHREKDDKVITVVSNRGNKIQFTKREVIEYERSTKEALFFDEFALEVNENIKNFVKKENIVQIETSYFPAFRTMLEAWSSQQENRDREYRRRESTIKMATDFSRNLFGQFLPKINFPSPHDIENSLRNEIRDAQLSIARYESSVFSNSFVKVFSALIEGVESDTDANQLLIQISELSQTSGLSKIGELGENSSAYHKLRDLVVDSSHLKKLNSSAAGALSVYRDALKERKDYQLQAFKAINKYFQVVNTFLDQKELAYELDSKRRIPKVGLRFPDESWSRIMVMSSGERQLLTMLYAVNKMSGNSIVLIDEPELSLHIDWQEELLEKMMEQLGERQIIVCTHSPSIAADFEQYMKEVVPIFNESGTLIGKENDEEDEDLF